MPRIDAHHHLWQYSPLELPWISESMKALRRDFLPDDLRQVLALSGIYGAIAVQASQTVRETEWLLELASAHSFMRGVVGWVGLVESGAAEQLAKFATNRKFLGVRHVLQDEPDDFYILRDDFNRGIALLKELNLTYDILIFERHLPQTIKFVDRHPQQRFVLDHIAKPRIKDALISPWRENIAELARRPNVYCKLSGVVTEADWNHWTEDSLRPYLDTVLEAFRPKRLMFGSDWPVALLATSYQRWVDTLQHLTASLSSAEQSRIFGETAEEAYRL